MQYITLDTARIYSIIVYMITVQVQGQGVFTIHPDKLNELLTWLAQHSMPIEASTRKITPGETLLNE